MATEPGVRTLTDDTASQTRRSAWWRTSAGRWVREPRARARAIVAALAALSVFVALSVSAIGLTSRNEFCASCHEMQADLGAYRRSSHASVSCYGCHMPAGANPAVFMLHKMGALKKLYLHWTGAFEKPINSASHYALSESKSAECLQCHSPETRRFTPPAGILIDHRAHVVKGIQCSQCHNRTAHPGLSGYSDFMTMEGCFRCHAQESASSTGPALRKDKGGPSAGTALVATGACDRCHSPTFELLPTDHAAPGWLPDRHYVAAEQRDRGVEEAGDGPADASGGAPERDESDANAVRVPGGPRTDKPCGVCHAKGFCDNCHGVPMPHPTSFRQKHAQQGRVRTGTCMKCHGEGPETSSTDFCGSCHHGGLSRRRWLRRHFVEVRGKGATACLACHQPSYCAHCHVGGR